MIKEMQLRVMPRVAASDDAIIHFIASEQYLPQDRVAGVRVIKRSIDARQRNVMVNLTVRVYVDEPMTDDYLVPPIDYRPVSGDKTAIVVGAGPGGLFAALRLIELGVSNAVRT